MTPTPCLTVAQVAELTGHGTSTIYRLIEDGDLPAVRVGKKALSIPVPDYESWLKNNRTVAS